MRKMILAIDMGNTNIEIGCLDDEKIYFTERVSTDRTKTELEYAVLLKTIMELHGVTGKSIEGAIISSVVPPLTKILRLAVKKVTDCDAFVVGAGVRTGLDIRVDNPAQVGADLIVDAVAAAEEYGYPCIVIDMGTATTISVIDRNKNFLGGMIIPGLQVSLDSLANRTSQLPHVSLDEPKKVIGTNTVDCMKSGIIYSTAGSIDGATTETFKKDAEAGVEYLKSTGRFSKVGVLGHSEGGTIAFLIASEDKADFIVSLAGGATQGKEAVLTQNYNALKAQGIPSEQIGQVVDAVEEVFDKLIASPED